MTGGGLDRLGLPLYVELHLVLNNETRALAEQVFLENTAVRQQHMVSVIQAFVKRRKFCRVFLPADRSLPCGWFFQQLGLSGRGTRPEYWKALLVAFQGQVNPMPCQHCLTTYARSVTASGEHVNAPFFDCTSDSTLFGGACASCVYGGHQGACSWAIFKGYQPPVSSPAAASLHLSGQDNDAREKGWFQAPHPMEYSIEVPGSDVYLSWGSNTSSPGELGELAKELWNTQKGRHRQFLFEHFSAIRGD